MSRPLRWVLLLAIPVAAIVALGLREQVDTTRPESSRPTASDARKSEVVSTTRQPGDPSVPVDDRRTPPPDPAPGQAAAPPNSVATPTLSDWLVRAERGEVRAQCEVAKALATCREAGDIDRVVNARIERHAQQSGPGEDIDQLARLQTRVEQQRAVCAGVSAEVFDREWRYLLAAAEAGDLRAAFDFVVAPPIDLQRPLEMADAVTAYRARAPGLIDALVARGAREGVALAFHRAQGDPFLGQSPLGPRSAEGTVRYGTALSAEQSLNDRQRAALETALAELSPTQLRRAQAEGVQLAARTQPRLQGSGEARHAMCSTLP